MLINWVSVITQILVAILVVIKKLKIHEVTEGPEPGS
jgi:hypothetical protein